MPDDTYRNRRDRRDQPNAGGHEPEVERQAVSLFSTERREDLWAILLAAALVALMLAGVRV